ncbi:WD40 repeat-containing protein [Histomonas meleagridis]|uniref:WD40 repeat-containing protein n=1 Tax=Histomonas meleagridis TaxID=135588 RepID=UPI00355A20C5|nr:WD40 repeat-containing protein [Histomonas meleagridis]KAH0805479.1 WD40 repeat-containing protein [Histomonas meleagridis]
MRAIVGDILGKCRIMDLWEDSTISRICGNDSDAPDREWGIDSIVVYNETKGCMLHNCGAASLIDIDSNERKNILHFDGVTNGYSLSFQNDTFIAGFGKKCVIFNEEKEIGSFETIENPSCASIFNNKISYGHLSDRTTIFDIAKGEKLWTAAEPPFDELKIQLEDVDRSILMMNDDIVIVGQNDSFILVYDIRSSNEAVIRTKIFEEFPITALAKISDNLVAFGDTIGSITIMTLNVPDRRVDGFKGFTGAPAGVLCMSPHPSLPVFAALTCDRVVRMYDYTKHALVPQKVAFTKTLSHSVAMLNDNIPEPEDSSENDWAELPEDDGDLWTNFVPCPQAKKGNL